MRNRKIFLARMNSMIVIVVLFASCAITSCQVLEDCRTNAFPPKENIAIEEFVVNLDLPPQERWTHIVMKKKDGIKKFVDYFRGMMPSFLFNTLTNFLEKGIKKFPKPYGDEIIGIAKAIDMPLAHILACNIFYELEKVCTSIIAEDEKGHVYHGRNLDLGALLGWDPKGDTWQIAEFLRPLTIAVDYQSGGKTVFKTVQFAGTVGVFTGIAPGRFSFSLNSRSPDTFFGGPMGVVHWVLSGSTEQQFASILARSVLENAESYDDAVKRLSESRLLAPVYYIVAGTEKHQGTIITRSKTQSIKPLRLSDKQNFLVQTNYDNWKKPPFYDNRRKPANICLKQMTNKNSTKKLDFFEMLYNVLSTVPVLNKATIYTTLMDPSTGEIQSFRRDCTGDCYPW
eukprot:TCONS_00031601-protein